MHIQKQCFQQPLVLILFSFLITLAGEKVDCVLEGTVELVEMKSLLSSTFRLNLSREKKTPLFGFILKGDRCLTCLLFIFV